MNKIIKAWIVIAFLTSHAFAHIPSECWRNQANFDYELMQPFSSSHFNTGWGPRRATLQLSSALIKCMSSNELEWQRQRIIAAADYWIKQKLNYCHHYLPNFSTPRRLRNKARGGGYCSHAKDIMPATFYRGQAARWNYSGQGHETSAHWLNDAMWQGMDCSNYTTFLYNFAFGQLFSSNIRWQAGQRKDTLQKNISPNEQSMGNILDNPHAAGSLVCRDNSLEVKHSCALHGGYLSVVNTQGIKQKGVIKASDLAALPLYPGDLLFISATGAHSSDPSKVTHVVMWIGKQVGFGPNDIPPSQIAPDGTCPQKDWMPRVGDWVITDSHYQGPDYRVITHCFYLNNLWGVRRVID